MWSSILVDFGFVFTLRQRHNFEHFYNMLTSDDFYDVLKVISQKTSPITSMIAILALVQFLVNVIMT
jgi:hypothetical protein